MNRYLMTIEYDGKPFNGWQTQDGKYTIEGEIEKAIESIVHESVKVCGSGRTDSGVHALGQTAHFDTETEIDTYKFTRSMNYFLPSEIAIKDVKKVANDFHARYDVKIKTYLYKIYVGSSRSPLREGRYMYTPFVLDVAKMALAVKDLIGEHDFSGLMTQGSSVKTTIRTIYDARVESHGDEIFIYVSGSGFLYNMVRTIAGTLVDIGRGKKDIDAIKHIVAMDGLAEKGAVAPPEGLYLYSVEY